MNLNPQTRHTTRRGLFSPSSGRVVSEVAKARTDMTHEERVSSDRRAVARARDIVRTAGILKVQQSDRRLYEIQRDAALQASNLPMARHRPLDRSRLARRTFLGAMAATVAATKAFADTPFTSFAFPGAGFPTSRTMPARIADIFNVLDFGADPTGVVDSQPAVTLAIAAAANNGIIFFPKGTYLFNSPVLIPGGSSLIFSGVGGGTSLIANFNGFIFDNLTNPWAPAGNGASIIEQMGMQNQFSGNNFTVTAAGTWSQSASPVSITLSGSNPGVAAGGALWINDPRLSTNSVFVGMITSVASWPNVTVSSTAIASGATSNLSMHVVQCYAANGSWIQGASTITMATSPPAGIGTGQYYIYDYETILGDPTWSINIGVATWSGTTLTFTSGTGALRASVGTTDRLWLAPVAGCVRYSSVVGATVRDCGILGFIGVTCSEDKVVNSGSTEGFEITVERCNIVNPSGFAGLTGQTGIDIQNNSLSYYNSFNSCWCGVRLSGTANSVIGGRAEVCYFGYLLNGDGTSSIESSANSIIATLSLESNIIGIYVGAAANLNINAVGGICNAVNPIAGLLINAASGVVQNSSMIGNFGTGYGIYITDPGTGQQNLTFVSCKASNFSTPSQAWRIPALSWWGTCIQSDNPALEYTFANLPSGTASPTPFEGETYDISDCNTSTFLATAAAGGSGATAHRRVRWNAVSSLWQVVG